VELPDLITTVHRSLSALGISAPVEEVLTPAVSVRQSVRYDYVVCLDCGYRGRTLRRHISTRHGLSRTEYLSRWGLSRDHLLTAPAYSERRSTLAKQLGLGRKPKAAATPVAAQPPMGDAERVEADLQRWGRDLHDAAMPVAHTANVMQAWSKVGRGAGRRFPSSRRSVSP